MEEKIGCSEFYDIIESKANIWKLNEDFKKNKETFFELIQKTEDYDLVFDKIECKKKLEEFVSKQLAVKLHQHELIEMKGNVITYYQPFKGTTRKVNIEDDHLAENPTLVYNGRLLVIGGNKGYSSSRKVY